MTDDFPSTELLERIKISCLSTGIRLSDEADRLLSADHSVPLSLHEYPTTGGVTLELPRGVYVNAPFDETFCHLARVTLVVRDGSLALEFDGETVPVCRFVPLPGYLDAKGADGRAVTDVAMSHVDRVRVSPFVGCAYDCSFCDLADMQYQARSSDQLLTALRVAQADEQLPVRHVLISGGSPRRGHYGAFEETCAAVIRAAGMPVDIMMSPMVDGTGFIDRMVEAGVAGLAINIELHGDRSARTFLGAKYRSTRAYFEDFMVRAVELLGRTGRVRSLIIPGLEPVADTLAGVEYLASLGCHPVLSPFRPARNTALETVAPPTEDLLALVLEEARAITAAHGVALGPECVACQHNTLSLPWDVVPTVVKDSKVRLATYPAEHRLDGKGKTSLELTSPEQA